MVVVRSRGPSHCTSRSGSVWARNTRAGGASHSRVIMTIGTLGSAVIAVLLIVVPLTVADGYGRDPAPGRLAVRPAGRRAARGSRPRTAGSGPARWSPRGAVP